MAVKGLGWASAFIILGAVSCGAAWSAKPSQSSRGKAEPSGPLDRPEGFYGVVRRVDQSKGEVLIDQEMTEGAIKRIGKIYKVSPDAAPALMGIKPGDHVAFMLVPGFGVPALMGIVKLGQSGW